MTDFRDHIPLRTEWAAALRSGKFKQTRGQLYNKNDDGYCCLGVYCVVAGLKLCQNGYAILDEDGLIVGYSPLHKAMSMAHHTFDFARLNDKYNLSFDQIADFVEGKGPTLAEIERAYENKAAAKAGVTF